jgi:hypothetical protein
MADIAHEVYAEAPQDVLSAAQGNPCAYTNAIDSVGQHVLNSSVHALTNCSKIQLADTFLGIACSLQKPRASFIRRSGGRCVQYRITF